MARAITIGLIGDHDAAVAAHRAIPLALRRAGQQVGQEVQWQWVPTPEITASQRVADFHGIWCVPGSPYRHMDGALLAIRHAREMRLPFLGSCGGFQHAVIEYARNVLGWSDAEHAETAPAATRQVIAPLSCALVGATDLVRLFPGSRIAAAYGARTTTEGYRCSYGLNEGFRAALLAGPLRVTADDAQGDVRAVELGDHPFFIATLFQPELAALQGVTPPVVTAFVRACAGRWPAAPFLE